MWIECSNTDREREREREYRYNNVYNSKFDFFFFKKLHPTNKYCNRPGNRRFWQRDNGAPFFERHIISNLKTRI